MVRQGGARRGGARRGEARGIGGEERQGRDGRGGRVQKCFRMRLILSSYVHMHIMHTCLKK